MKCKTHRTYRAKREPGTDCEKCWLIWLRREVKLLRATEEYRRAQSRELDPGYGGR